MISQILSLLVFSVAIAIPGPTAHGQTVAQLIQNAVSPSVVRISTTIGSGYGVVVAPGIIMTVDKLIPYGISPGQIQLYTHNDRPASVSSIDFITERTTAGVVLLKTPAFRNVSAVQFSDADPSIGQRLYSIGNIQGAEFAIFSGEVSKVSHNRIFVSMGTGRSSQGGPVFEESGRLVGLIVQQPQDKEASIQAISHTILKEVLYPRRIPVSTRAVIEPPEDKTSPAGDITYEMHDGLRQEYSDLQERHQKCIQASDEITDRLRRLQLDTDRYRDSLYRSLEDDRRQLAQSQKQFADERMRAEARIRSTQSMIDSLERLKDVLKVETNALNESIRYLESKRAENRSFVSKLESEREELLESNRVLRDRNQNLMNSTVIPRLRFEARVSGIYMGYRSDGVRDPAMIIRGEAGLGYRFGLTGTKSTGDVIGVYAAIVRHDLSTAGQWSISGYDAGLFVDFNNDFQLKVGVGDGPSTLSGYGGRNLVALSTLRLAGSDRGSWGIALNCIVPENARFVRLGGGLWFSFGANFLRI